MASSSNHEEGKRLENKIQNPFYCERKQWRILSSHFYASSGNQRQILSSTNSKQARKLCPPKFASASLQMQTIPRGLNRLLAVRYDSITLQECFKSFLKLVNYHMEVKSVQKLRNMSTLLQPWGWPRWLSFREGQRDYLWKILRFPLTL